MIFMMALHKLMLNFKLAKRTYYVEIRKRFWQLMDSGNRDVDFSGVNTNSKDKGRGGLAMMIGGRSRRSSAVR